MAWDDDLSDEQREAAGCTRGNRVLLAGPGTGKTFVLVRRAEHLADDWNTLAADDAGWEDGYPDPKFLGAWRAHREVYGYTLRSELVYQLLSEMRANPNFKPRNPTDVIIIDEYQDLNRCDLNGVA